MSRLITDFNGLTTKQMPWATSSQNGTAYALTMYSQTLCQERSDEPKSRLLEMAAMQNSMVEIMNSPDIKTNIPVVKENPVKMSLYKLFDLFILPPKGPPPSIIERNVHQ